MHHQYQYSSRSQRSKGLKVKHVFQIALFLAISIWLVYQMKKFYPRMQDYTADTVYNLDKEFLGLKFGRKEKLDGIQMVSANRAGVDDNGGRKEDGSGDNESEKSRDKEAGDEVLNATNEVSEKTMDNHEEEDNEKQQEKEVHGEKSETEATNEENVENESSDDQHRLNKGDVTSSDDQEQHLGENDNDDQLKDGEEASQEESPSSEEHSTHSDKEEEHQQEEEESTSSDKTINGHKEEEQVLDSEQEPQKKVEENAEEVKEEEVGQQEHQPNDQENVKYVHDSDNSTASGNGSEEEVAHQDQVQPKAEENVSEIKEEEPQTKEEEPQSNDEEHSGLELNNEEKDQVVHQEEHNIDADNSTLHNANSEDKPDSQIPNSESRATEIGGKGEGNQEEQNANNSATAPENKVQTSSEETTLVSQDNANNGTEVPQFKLSDNNEASTNVTIGGGSSSDNPTEGAMDNGAVTESTKPQKYEEASETDNNDTKIENIVLQGEDANSVNEFASETISTVLAQS